MLSNTNELITFQIGPLANRFGVHYWNLQECNYIESTKLERIDSNFEYPILNHILFESSINNNNKPRLVAMDMRETIDFGLDLEISSINSQSDYPIWSGKIDHVMRATHNTDSFNCNENWLKCLSHNTCYNWHKNDVIFKLPFSLESHVNQLSENFDSQNRSPLSSLSTFTQGRDSLRSGSSTFEELEDRIRRIAECCCRPDGFQMMMDAEDGFSGIASILMEYINEEFPKRSILSVPLFNSGIVKLLDRRQQQIAASNQLALLNLLESTGDMCTHGAWLPLDASSVYEQTHLCKVMATLAASFDTVTTSFRLRPQLGGMNFDSFFSIIDNTVGRKMLSIRSAIYSDQLNNSLLSSPLFLNWLNLNPYGSNHQNNSTHNTILYRCMMSRGVKNSTYLDNLFRLLSQQSTSQQSLPVEQKLSQTHQSFGEISSNNHEENNNNNYSLPLLSPGSFCQFVYSLPQYNLKIIPNTYCQQWDQLNMIGLIDCPNYNSNEFIGLNKLYQSLRHLKLSPDKYMESDIWKELLESSQTYLVESYRML